MAITAVTHRTYGETNTGGSTSVATASGAFTPVANRLCRATIVTRGGSNMYNQPSVSGCSLTWSLVARRSATALATHSQWVFVGWGASPSSGEVTFTAGGADTFDAAIIQVDEVTAGGPLYVSQVVHKQFDTADPALQTIAITPIEGNCLLCGVTRQTAGSCTELSGWTELKDDNTATTTVQLATYYRLSTDTVVGGTTSSTTGGGAVIGIEVTETAPTISLVGMVSTTVPAGGSSTAITLPSGVAENDIVLVAQACDDALSVAGGDGGITTAGYNFIHGDGAFATPGRVVAWKRMGGTPDANVTIDQLAGATQAVCVQVFRNVDTTTAIDATTTTATGTSASPDPASITTVTNNARVIAIFMFDDDDCWGSPVQGYRDPCTSNTLQGSTTVGASVGICSMQKTALGAEDPGTFATTGSDQWATATVALRPVVAATGQGLLLAQQRNRLARVA
jgi:hypothetical protein